MNDHEHNLRDLFAGLATIGLLMKANDPDESRIAKAAYIMADALIEHRTNQAVAIGATDD